MHVEFFYCKTQRVSCRKSNKLTSSRHTLQTHGAFRFVVRLKWSRRDQLSSFKINKCPIIEKMLLVTSQKSSYRSVYKHTQVRPSWRLRWWPNSRRGKANKLHAFLIVRNLNKSLSIYTMYIVSNLLHWESDSNETRFRYSLALFYVCRRHYDKNHAIEK